MSKVKIDIGKGRRSNRIDVVFKFDRKLVAKIKGVPGARWQRSDAIWSVPLDLDTCRILRETFGHDLKLSKELKNWARIAMANERNLGTLANAVSADLVRLPYVLPELYKAIHVGPRGRWMTPEQVNMAVAGEPPSYQAADVAFMATSPAPGNFNEPGTGKTIETIAAVYEAGMDRGLHLVVAPISSMYSVWERELLTWTDAYVIVARGNKRAREAAISEAVRLATDNPHESVWLITNPSMFTPEKDNTNTSNDYVRKAKPKEEHLACKCQRLADPHWHYKWKFDLLHRSIFVTKIVDEAHDAAVGNNTSLTAVGLHDIKALKTMVLTATPFGGKVIKLFGLLHFLRPDEFPSKWTWADKWLYFPDDTDSGYGKNLNKAKIDPAKAMAFYRSLAPYVLRRKKSEVLPWLPPKQYVEIWAEMEGKQRKQYEEFEANSEVLIQNEHLSATSILAEYTRLRQIAGAYCDRNEAGDVRPTSDSCKLPHLMQILEERGIVGDDPSGEEQVVIFSQFSQMVDMIYDYLLAQGAPVAKLTGHTTQPERDALQDAFQREGGLRVLVMSTKAGGVSITLDRASTVVIMDETWNPDNQEQAEDRCHRASRIHQVTIYYIRTKGSIEEYVFDTTTGKSLTNEEVLDVRRRMENKPSMSKDF